MSARRFSKHKGGERVYLYYVCVTGAYHKRDQCSARKYHKAEEAETQAWNAMSGGLKGPERLHAGLDYMIEQRKGVARTAIPQPRRRGGWKRSRKQAANVSVIRRLLPKD